MQLHVLGVAAGYPGPGAACSGYLVADDRVRIGLDLGTGTLERLLCKTPVQALDGLCFSHWHGDHCSDALSLVYYMDSVEASQGAAFCPLPVYGPEDECSPVLAIIRQSSVFDFHTLKPGDSCVIGGVTVRVGPTRHPVPGLMYRLERDDRTLVYTGDGNTTAEQADFCQSADILLADGCFTKAMWTAAGPHMSAYLTGKLAQAAGVKRLLVTHLNHKADPAQLVAEAREAFAAAEAAQAGKVYEY